VYKNEIVPVSVGKLICFSLKN